MDTLLTSFIKDELADYNPPDPGGIGFSKPKHESALFSLTLMPKRDVSQAVVTNYDVLKAWRWQDAYKKMVKKFEHKFSRIFVNELTTYATIYGTTFSGKKGEEYFAISHDLHALLPFSDVAIFNDNVTEKIFVDADNVILPDPGSKKLLKLVLEALFLIRGGFQKISEDGKLEILDEAMVSYRSSSGYIEFFNAAKFLRKPLRPPKHIIAKGLEEFLKRMEKA